MIVHNLSSLFEKVSEKTRYSSIEVKQVVNEVFRVLKEKMSTYPETPAFLLNKFANIYLQPKELRTMINKRIMGDEQKAKWQEALNMATHYHDTRKLINKHKDDREIDNSFDDDNRE